MEQLNPIHYAVLVIAFAVFAIVRCDTQEQPRPECESTARYVLTVRDGLKTSFRYADIIQPGFGDCWSWNGGCSPYEWQYTCNVVEIIDRGI